MCSNILEYTRSNCSNTWRRVTEALFRYFVSSTKLLISSTKLLATGNLARDGFNKSGECLLWPVSVPCITDTDLILVSVSVHLMCVH